MDGLSQIGAADVVAALGRGIAPGAVFVPVPCRQAQLAVVAHGDGTPSQVLDALNYLGLAQVVHLSFAEVVHPGAGRSVGIDRIQHMVRRYIDMDRSDRIKRADWGDGIRREFFAMVPGVRRLRGSCLWLSRLRRSCLSMDALGKVRGHRYQAEHCDTQQNARRDPWMRDCHHDVIAPIKTIEFRK